jgi:hypothetical protein
MIVATAETRTQLALVKQIRRQINNANRRMRHETTREIKHEIERRELVDDHFEKKRDAIKKSFDDHASRIDERFKINNFKAHLIISEKIDTMFDELDELETMIKNHKPIDTNFDGMEYKMNDNLFFKNLYDFKFDYIRNSNNDTFYTFITCMIIIFCINFM